MSELEQQILVLKGRVFDLTESLNQVRQNGEHLATALSTIAAVLGVQPDEHGNVRIQDITAAVESLLPVQEELPVE